MASTLRRVSEVPELVGIGGWLILIAIGQVLGPLGMVAAIAKYYTSEVNADMLEQYPLTFYGEILMDVALLAIMICTTILFFRHSRLFPRFFIVELILLVALPLIDTLWAAATVAMYSGDSFTDLLTMEPQDIGQIIGRVIIGPIWMAYILRSRRVANTFVK